MTGKTLKYYNIKVSHLHKEDRMTRKTKLGMAVVFTIVGIVVGLTLSSNFDIQTKGYSDDVNVSEEAVQALTRVSDAMVKLVAAVRPSVVNISTTRTVRRQQQGPGFFNDPFFRRFFGDKFTRPFQQPQEEQRTSLGSGVIVDDSGYILTNNHVVQNAEEITVTLWDKREFKGEIIGTDPKTDLAVVRIETNGLKTATWGDSDALKVGELVVAVGSPYGLSQTVTSGIVSAKGRANVRIADYEDFIQTDAAINPGNSGGPLINTRGEVVGINTAIFSTTGGYQGIGFSIPSNMARAVMESLIKEGKVTRGWLGVTIQPITKELADQFGLDNDEGSLVSDVVQGSPAEQAGLKRGDIIMEYRGKKMGNPTELRNAVASTPPGTEAKLGVVREGKKKTLIVSIGELPEDISAFLRGADNALVEVQVQDITPEIRRSLGISEKVEGVVVTFAGEDTGLRRGDVVLEINRTPVTGVEEYGEIVSQIGAESDILLLVYREGGVFYMTIKGKK
jgi:serine protease Do